MTIELVLILIALWILFGLIDAWILHERGYSGWRRTLLCVVSGPLAVSVLYDQLHDFDAAHGEADPTGQDTTDSLNANLDDDTQPIADAESEWPRDDPEGPFVMQGYRGLADH